MSGRLNSTSRSAAQACTDLRERLAEEVDRVTQEPVDGARGCVVTGGAGAVRIVVTPHASGDGGANITVTARRPPTT